MKDRTSVSDCNIYSPSLRTILHMRATRMLMRNQSKVYIIANVDQDVRNQIERAKTGASRYTDAILRTNEIIWDVNVTSNTVNRLQEENLMTVLDGFASSDTVVSGKLEYRDIQFIFVFDGEEVLQFNCQ